ncbi:hypothetical protein [Streptomyces griseicoloratus]|uniref:hypothetical protein n=1 Tax=Streptomyces griseicoloratus TaxID=2752516 RepID=UPI001CB748CC|nr:hypothetical protein [Streptomyces griseicoloratus]
MAVCEVCNNDYEMAFEVRTADATHIFDSLECAAQLIAPTCSNCECRILGHGLQAGDGDFFCCAHCARQRGHAQLVDHA